MRFDSPYSVRKINGEHYVVHDETGATIPYKSKARKNTSIKNDPKYAYKIEYFTDWFNFSNPTRIRIKDMSGFSTATMSHNPFDINYMSLADCTTTTAKAACNPIYEAAMKEEEGKTTMNYNTERDYLDSRVVYVYNDHETNLVKHFKISAVGPETVEEAVERIKAGNYQLTEKKNRSIWTGWSCDIIWRAPGEEPDTAGYKVAREKLDAAYHTVRDVVMTQDSGKGLAALNEFKSATFH